jgi:hypothetical protein
MHTHAAASKWSKHGMYRVSRRVEGYATWYVPGIETRRRVCRTVCTGYRDASKGVPHGMYRVSRRVEGFAARYVPGIETRRRVCHMVCTGHQDASKGASQSMDQVPERVERVKTASIALPWQRIDTYPPGRQRFPFPGASLYRRK